MCAEVIGKWVGPQLTSGNDPTEFIIFFCFISSPIFRVSFFLIMNQTKTTPTTKKTKTNNNKKKIKKKSKPFLSLKNDDGRGMNSDATEFGGRRSRLLPVLVQLNGARRSWHWERLRTECDAKG